MKGKGQNNFFPKFSFILGKPVNDLKTIKPAK